MCLAIVALDAHPRFALLVAANRDEYHARPALPAAWWRAAEGGVEILAGRDLEAGGTWLGVNRQGRFAFVTNVREPGRHDPAAPSRGGLVPAVLADRRDIAVAVADTVRKTTRYNGFNLLAGDRSSAFWASNRATTQSALDAGVHGISNAALDTPWPKLLRTRAGVAHWAAQGREDMETLFALLGDRTRPPDDALPSTGVSLEWERTLSSPFIAGDRYGTRCSTVLTIARDGAVRFEERAFDPHGTPAGTTVHAFSLVS